MESSRLEALLEACLATSRGPVSSAALANAVENEGVEEGAIESMLCRLAGRWEQEKRGLRLERVAGGWRMITAPEFDPYLRSVHGAAAKSRLSTAALEVLAIVGYRQPVTLPEINFVRGVNSSSALRTLFDRGLVRVAGRKSVVGKPFLYRTTTGFLEHFGLDKLQDLPAPEELLGEETSGAGVGEEEDRGISAEL